MLQYMKELLVFLVISIQIVVASSADLNSSFVQCGNSQKLVDECFKDLPPHLMEFLQNPKIIISKNEIDSKCIVFERGMRCFDDYTARCLPNRNLQVYKNNVEGARNFFHKFCGNPEFQRDYLRHKDCFIHIQEDWLRCTDMFKSILTNELHRNSNFNEKFIEFCCARYAYENCIYNSARFKCYQHSAIFARDTARMLTDEKHFSNCQQYENVLCSNFADSLHGKTAGKLCWFLLLTVIVVATQQFKWVKGYYKFSC